MPEALHHFTVLYHTHQIHGNKFYSPLQDTDRNFTPQTDFVLTRWHKFNISALHKNSLNSMQNYVGPPYDIIHKTVCVCGTITAEKENKIKHLSKKGNPMA